MAQRIVAGNWKMNLNHFEAELLVEKINDAVKDDDVRTILIPPSVLVSAVADRADQDVETGVQNFYFASSGAYTGEISIGQCISAGASIGLIGHSERRDIFGESNDLLKSKVDAAVEENFNFIFCCGEPLEVREAGGELAFVKTQLDESLFHLSPEEFKGAIIAYEPIWAIGTGKTATTEQAESMHKNIRSWIRGRYGNEIAESTSILYGGSCKPSNARELFACANIDGGLIGGASLIAEDFVAIINSF